MNKFKSINKEHRNANINAIFAGHYASETFGVKAIMKRLSKDFDVKCEFICEKAFDCLAAPPVRIGAQFTPVPTSPILEDAYLPSLQNILESAKKLMEY